MIYVANNLLLAALCVKRFTIAPKTAKRKAGSTTRINARENLKMFRIIKDKMDWNLKKRLQNNWAKRRLVVKALKKDQKRALLPLDL